MFTNNSSARRSLLKRALLTGIIAILLFPQMQAQNVPDRVVDAFEKGRSKMLSEYLHKSLEINMLSQKHTVSRNQAIRIIQDFFDEHPPKKFEVTYEGAKTEAKFSVCNYHSEKEKYRVNLYFMEQSGQKVIYFMSIEKI